MEGLRCIFQGVEDLRKSNATKHDLTDMLAITLLATLSGWSSRSSFARYARCKWEFLCGSWSSRAARRATDAFSDLSDALNPEQLAVDGKVLRGAIMDASKQSALHLMQAFEPGAGLVLGQMKFDGKSNETAAIPGLLEILVLVGRTAADAIHTRREASARIVEKGNDYVLPVKRNQKSMHKDVQVWFADPEARKEMLSCRHVGDGRVGTPIATSS